LGKFKVKVMEQLLELGIRTQVLYIPVYRQPYYRVKYNLNFNDFVETEKFYKYALSIPMYPKMSNLDVDRVISALNKFLTK
jgi:dTDP-4-amino-4,6-dideoxygalactose transaminase